MSSVVLSDDRTRVEIVPAEGARVQHVTDLVSSRELLYQRTPPPGLRSDFVTGCPGGWDEMFPNDTPWAGHPDHGRIWSLAFEVVKADAGRALMRARLTEPAVSLQRRFALLAPPRRGLRVEIHLEALADTGPFLWTSHPMLAVAPGWTIDVGGAALEGDNEAPGRYAETGHVEVTLAVPPAGEGWSEVLYATGPTRAAVISPDGRHGTRMTWDAAFLRHLWVVTVTGQFDLDLCLLFEPSTSRPYRVDDAVAEGEAAALAGGETRRWWTELESLDSAESR
jgi:hypothetical protein